MTRPAFGQPKRRCAVRSACSRPHVRQARLPRHWPQADRLGRRDGSVRDGEVAVSVYQHDAAAGTNQLETARQAAQSEAVARGQAERRLAAAQETIRELQTQLAHERLARDELVQRATGEREAAEQALASLRAELLTVRAALRQTEQRLQALLERPAEDPRGRRTGSPRRIVVDALPEGAAETMATPSAPARRRGRPRKVVQPEPASDFVEWWKPGWKERLR